MWKISIKTLQEFQDNGGGGLPSLPCNAASTVQAGTQLFNGRIKLSLILSQIKENICRHRV